jgi:hypothetical protein
VLQKEKGVWVYRSSQRTRVSIAELIERSADHDELFPLIPELAHQFDRVLFAESLAAAERRMSLHYSITPLLLAAEFTFDELISYSGRTTQCTI